MALLLACEVITLPADTWVDLDAGSPHAEDADLMYAQVTGFLYAWNGTTLYHQPGHIPTCAGVATSWTGIDLSRDAPCWACVTTSEGEAVRLEVSNESGGAVRMRRWP